MDLDLVVLSGRLASAPELRTYDSGSSRLRLLVTVRSDAPRRRVDVIPVTWWEPPAPFLGELPEPGTRLWVTGRVQRRFWDDADGRRSRVEVVADHVRAVPPDFEPALAWAEVVAGNDGEALG